MIRTNSWTKNNSVAISAQANYTGRATATAVEASANFSG
jgi:hypothetical protein